MVHSSRCICAAMLAFSAIADKDSHESTDFQVGLSCVADGKDHVAKMRRITLGKDEFTAEIWTLGASVNDIQMLDRYGISGSVLLGYDSEQSRLKGQSFLGETVGPVANRIAAGGYSIDNVVYTPELNEPGATLHGGPGGFHRKEWAVEEETENRVVLSLDWEDPTECFPGPIHVQVEWSIDGMELTHHVTATTKAPTNINIVSHPYFNLSGTLSPITDHEIQVAASAYLPIDEASIPRQEAPRMVNGSGLNLTSPRILGEVIAGLDHQIQARRGLDHAYVLDGEGMRRAATLRHPASGRVLEIITDYPALQVYTGQYLGDSGVEHPKGDEQPYCGIALETEGFPDAPRRPDFPSVLVRPGQTYTQTTVWRFSIEGRN